MSRLSDILKGGGLNRRRAVKAATGRLSKSDFISTFTPKKKSKPTRQSIIVDPKYWKNGSTGSKSK